MAGQLRWGGHSTPDCFAALARTGRGLPLCTLRLKDSASKGAHTIALAPFLPGRGKRVEVWRDTLQASCQRGCAPLDSRWQRGEPRERRGRCYSGAGRQGETRERWLLAFEGVLQYHTELTKITHVAGDYR